MDNCGSFLIDFSRADNVSKNAVVGATVNLINQTELFTGIPWLEVKFSDPELDISVPLQYLIEEGDTFTLNNVGQSHPNAYAKDYRNKFNQDFFETIRTYVNRTSLNYGETLVNQIMNILPAWLTCDVGVEMTRNYVINSFVKGNPWNSEQDINGNDDIITLTGVTLKTPMGDASISGSWNKEKIENLALVLVAVRDVNKLNISSELMEAMLDLIIENNAQTGNGDKLNSLYHIDYDNVGSIIDSEILAKVTDANTYWQYQTTPEPETQVLRANSIAQFKEVGAAHPGEEILFTCNVGCIGGVSSSIEGASYSFIDDGTNGLMIKPFGEDIYTLQVDATYSLIDFPCTYLNDNGIPIMIYNTNPTIHSVNSWDTTVLEVKSTIKSTNLISKLVSIEVWNNEQFIFGRWSPPNIQTVNVSQIAKYSYGDDRVCITNWIGILEGVTIPVGKLIVTGFVSKDGDNWQIFPRNCEDISIIPIRHANNIQEFKELGYGGGVSDICIDGDVTVVYQSGRYIMIEDNTGGLMVNNGAMRRITNVYNPGDIISGGISGKYMGLNPTFIPSHNWQPSTNHTTINSTEVNNICNQSLLGKLVTVSVYNETEYQLQQNIAPIHNVTQISNNESIAIINANDFGTTDILLPAGNIKVTGFVGENGNGWQLWIRNNDDIQIISEPEIEND